MLRSPATFPDERALPGPQPRQFQPEGSPGGLHRGLTLAQESKSPAQRNPELVLCSWQATHTRNLSGVISCGQVGREFGAAGDSNATDQR